MSACQAFDMYVLRWIPNRARAGGKKHIKEWWSNNGIIFYGVKCRWTCTFNRYSTTTAKFLIPKIILWNFLKWEYFLGSSTCTRPRCTYNCSPNSIHTCMWPRFKDCYHKSIHIQYHQKPINTCVEQTGYHALLVYNVTNLTDIHEMQSYVSRT